MAALYDDLDLPIEAVAALMSGDIHGVNPQGWALLDERHAAAIKALKANPDNKRAKWVLATITRFKLQRDLYHDAMDAKRHQELREKELKQLDRIDKATRRRNFRASKRRRGHGG